MTSQKVVCSIPNPSTSLQRFLDVISDPDSVFQVNRQAMLLQSFLSATGNFVRIIDLRMLADVLRYLLPKVEFESQYRDAFEKILHVLKRPPVMNKFSDEINYKENLTDLFSCFGWMLLKTESRDYRCQVLEIILKFLSEERTTESNYVPIKTCIHSAEVSHLIECLCHLISMVPEELYHWTIYCVNRICELSDLCCWELLTRDMIDSLLVRLITIRSEERSLVMDGTCQLLWRLFCCTRHDADWSKVPVPSRTALRSLRYVLREESLKHTQSGNDVNDIAALTLQLMHLFPGADYVRSGLTEDIAFYATITETVIPIHILPYFNNLEDYLHFKKLMLACLSLSPACSACLDIFIKHKVPECLVAMLKCNANVKWTPDLELDLFKSALSCACALFSFLRQEFIKAGFLKILVDFLYIHYAMQKNYLDDLALSVVQAIVSSCANSKVDLTATKEALRSAGAVEVLLQVSEWILTKGSELTICNQAILTRNLCVLAVLMTNENEFQFKYSERCLKLTTTIYNKIRNPLPTDSLIDKRLIMFASNFFWETIVWNKNNILQFIKSGEIFTVLDVLEKSPISVQIVLLSVLVDICEYPQSIPYLITWRGKVGDKLLSMLCHIWRDEENRHEVLRDELHCISDLSRPLMGKAQYELTKTEKDKIISTYDVYGSVRPKIYAIFQLLRRHRESVDLCEDYYRLGHTKVSTEDQVTLQLVEAYFPLKLGEIWWEIREKQVKEWVQPLDRYLARTLAERYHDWALRVQRAQQTILKNQEAALRAEEEEYYSIIRKAQLTYALEALREVIAIARSADRDIFLSYNKKLLEGIEKSRATTDVDIRIAYPPDDVSVILFNSKTEVTSFSTP